MSVAPFIFMFDIDGTLLASGGAGKAALEEAFLEQFKLHKIEHHVPYSGRTDGSIAKELMDRHDVPSTQENIERLQRDYLSRLPSALIRNKGRVLPGVQELIHTLKSDPKCRLGLLTGNIRAGAEVKLGHFQLYQHFTFGGFGDLLWDRDDVARQAVTHFRQQHPETFTPEQIWVLGDTPLDIRCARAIGAKVLAVATGQHSVSELASYQPDLVLQDLSDLAKLREVFRL